MSFQRNQDFQRYFGTLRGTMQFTRWETNGWASSQVLRSYLLSRFLGGNRFQTRDGRIVTLSDVDMDSVWQEVVAQLNTYPNNTRYTQYRPSSNAAGCSPGLIIFVIIIICVIAYGASQSSSSTASNSSSSTNSSSTTDNTSSSDAARSTIQQYYDAINNKDYRTAYNMWSSNAAGGGQSYDQFAAGYSNTTHDDITFDSIDPQNDGTVIVNITIHATEQDQTETFRASYVLTRDGNNWSISSGSAEKVA